MDNFEDGFEDVIVRDGESVGIELTASAPRASINTVLFTACVPYGTVRRVHEARASQVHGTYLVCTLRLRFNKTEHPFILMLPKSAI